MGFDGEEGGERGLLLERGNELGVEDAQRRDFPFNKPLDAVIGHRFDLEEGRGVGEGEIGKELAANASEELDAFAAGGDEMGRGVKLKDFAEKVRVKGAAEAFVGAVEEDEGWAGVRGSQEGVSFGGCTVAEGCEEVLKEGSIMAAGERSLLGLAHFGGSHHLHSFCDLSRVADGPNASADGASVEHCGLKERC